MGKVRIEELKTGLTLAKDIKNSQGQLLIRSGVQIQERHFMLLRSWGISMVDVHEETEEGSAGKAGQDKGAASPELLEMIKERFRHNDLSLPVIKEIFELCAKRKPKG